MKTFRMTLLRIFRVIEFIAVKLILQRVVGTIFLFLVYVLVIGPTSIVMKLFFKSRLRHATVNLSSSWVASSGYSESIERSKFQS